MANRTFSPNKIVLDVDRSKMEATLYELGTGYEFYVKQGSQLHTPINYTSKFKRNGDEIHQNVYIIKIKSGEKVYEDSKGSNDLHDMIEKMIDAMSEGKVLHTKERYDKFTELLNVIEEFDRNNF